MTSCIADEITHPCACVTLEKPNVNCGREEQLREIELQRADIRTEGKKGEALNQGALEITNKMPEKEGEGEVVVQI